MATVARQAARLLNRLGQEELCALEVKKKKKSQYSGWHPRTYDCRANGVPGEGYNFWIWGRIWVKDWSTEFKFSSRPHIG